MSKRSLAKLILMVALMVAVTVVVFANSASAQQQRPRPRQLPRYVPRYTPASPTTSPYLNLLGRGGAAANYYTFVRPQQNQQAINAQQSYQLRSQNLRIDQVQTNLLQPESRETGRTGWFQTQRGPDSNFQNRSHFYQTWDARGVGGR